MASERNPSVVVMPEEVYEGLVAELREWQATGLDDIAKPCPDHPSALIARCEALCACGHQCREHTRLPGRNGHGYDLCTSPGCRCLVFHDGVLATPLASPPFEQAARSASPVTLFLYGCAHPGGHIEHFGRTYIDAGLFLGLPTHDRWARSHWNDPRSEIVLFLSAGGPNGKEAFQSMLKCIHECGYLELGWVKSMTTMQGQLRDTGGR